MGLKKEKHNSTNNTREIHSTPQESSLSLSMWLDIGTLYMHKENVCNVGRYIDGYITFFATRALSLESVDRAYYLMFGYMGITAAL